MAEGGRRGADGGGGHRLSREPGGTGATRDDGLYWLRRIAMKAVRVHKAGGPEGLVYENVPDPKAGAGQAVVKVEAIGLNFAEVNQRRNANPAGLPMPIG